MNARAVPPALGTAVPVVVRQTKTRLQASLVRSFRQGNVAR